MQTLGVIYPSVIMRRDLSDEAIRLYALLATHTDPLTTAEMSEQLGRAETRIAIILKELVDARVIVGEFSQYGLREAA